MQKAAKPILIRCYARKVGDQWVGVCLNFSLAAQAETFKAVRASLHSQIESYIRDATVGEDRAQREYLLNRRAPVRDYLIYARIVAQIGMHHFVNRGREHVARWIERNTLIPC